MKIKNVLGIGVLALSQFGIANAQRVSPIVTVQDARVRVSTAYGMGDTNAFSLVDLGEKYFTKTAVQSKLLSAGGVDVAARGEVSYAQGGKMLTSIGTRISTNLDELTLGAKFLPIAWRSTDSIQPVYGIDAKLQLGAYSLNGFQELGGYGEWELQRNIGKHSLAIGVEKREQYLPRVRATIDLG